jgi:hypothetical protein
MGAGYFRKMCFEDEGQNKYTLAHDVERGIGVTGCNTDPKDADRG